MKTFHLDMMNPFTGEPFSWEDPNVIWGEPACYLEPGDSGFVPYPGQSLEPVANSRQGDPMRLLELAKDTPHDGGRPLTISRYQYCIVPRPSGGFSAQPLPAAKCEGDTIDSAVSAATGIPEEKCAEVLAAYMDQLFMSAAGSRWANAMHNLLSMLPGSGDTVPVPEGLREAA